jgi:hypothetical protein
MVGVVDRRGALRLAKMRVVANGGHGSDGVGSFSAIPTAARSLPNCRCEDRLTVAGAVDAVHQ